MTNSNYSNIISINTLGQSGSLTIPYNHPRLWFNTDRLNKTKLYFQSNPFTPSDPFTNALAYLLTNNASYAQNAINWLMSYSIPAGQATPTAIGSDASRWDGENACIVFDWCYDQLTVSQKSTLISNWNNWFGNINQQNWGGVGMPMNNYYWGNLRNSLEWGIATYTDNSQAQSFIDHALTTRWSNSFKPFALDKGKGGVLQEGPGYGAVDGWYPLIPFTSCNLMGRNVWNESQFFKEVIYWLIYSTTPSQTTRKGDSANTYELFPFNDSEYPQNGSIFYSRKYFGDFMAQFSSQWNDLNVGQYARKWFKTVNPSVSWFVKALDNANALEKDYNTLPLDFYASGPKFGYSRSNWTNNCTSISLQLGQLFGVGHAHRDIGSFQIWRNGKWLSRETCGYSNSIKGYNQSNTLTNVDVSSACAHNIMLFDFIGQLADSWVKGNSILLALESNQNYFYASVDLTNLYKANADFQGRVPEAKFTKYIREFVFIKGSETLYICDRITTNTALTATFLLHSETNTPLWSTKAIQGNLINTRTIDEGVVNSWGQYRYEYDYTVGVGQTNIIRSISPNGISDLNTVLFNNTSGGSFNGTPFFNGIKNCNIADNGITWS